MTKSGDPDQMPHSVASVLGLHCCKGLQVPLVRVITVQVNVVVRAVWQSRTKTRNNHCSDFFFFHFEMRFHQAALTKFYVK